MVRLALVAEAAEAAELLEMEASPPNCPEPLQAAAVEVKGPRLNRKSPSIPVPVGTVAQEVQGAQVLRGVSSSIMVWQKRSKRVQLSERIITSAWTSTAG